MNGESDPQMDADGRRLDEIPATAEEIIQKAPNGGFDHVLVSMSGGKDSVATWLYLERDLGLDVTCVFADTGWESVQLEPYLKYLEKAGCRLVRLPQRKVRDLWVNDPTPERVEVLRAAGISIDDPLTMETLSAAKGRFPSTQARFCTTELKLVPLKKYKATLPGNVLMVSGVRADESPKRAKMAPYCWDDFMGCQRWLPLLSWTARDVFTLHSKHNIQPNPLYLQGQIRVGCWPCIHSRKETIRNMLVFDPEREEEILKSEKLVASCSKRGSAAFFAPDKAAMSYRSKDHKGDRYALFPQIAKWAKGEPSPWGENELPWAEELEQLDAGEDLTAPACTSPYGLCE